MLFAVGVAGPECPVPEMRNVLRTALPGKFALVNNPGGRG
jgi:hypothetical protein